MTGFNDFFFAIGILLLGFGMLFFTGGEPLPSAIAAVLIWALSELLVRRMRLVLPGILLSLFFILFVYLAVPRDFTSLTPMPVSPGMTIGNFVLASLGLSGAPFVAAVKALIGTAAASLYYWRFRLPFALLPIAASVVLAITFLVVLQAGPLPEIARAVVSLVCGLVVFGAAMSFDLSDRNRVTRRSDCAFWLHLLAAPLIVHSLIALIAPTRSMMTDSTAAVVLLIVAVLGFVAIVIDRRALLVSALIYIGFIIAYAIGGPGGAARGGIFFTTLLILGAFVIALGIGWQPLRRRLLALISPSIAGKLPPVPNRP
jgi:hypothetical protein